MSSFGNFYNNTSFPRQYKKNNTKQNNFNYNNYKSETTSDVNLGYNISDIAKNEFKELHKFMNNNLKNNNNKKSYQDKINIISNHKLPSLKDSLSNISFCDKQCYNINRNETKEKLLLYLQKKYKIDIIKNQYMVLGSKNLYSITKHQHILATLTCGNPYLIFLVKIDNVKWCIFIDRKLKNGYTYPKMHCTQYDFDDVLFEEETIFNGELVRDVNRHWKFIFSDIYIYKGINVKNTKNILSRIELIHNILNNEYNVKHEIEICPLIVKKLFQYKDLKYILNNFIPDLSYVTRGLVFYSMSNNYGDYIYLIPKEKQIQIKKINNEAVTIDYSTNKTYVEMKDMLSQNKSLLDTIQDSEFINKNKKHTFKIIKTNIPDIYNLLDPTNNNQQNNNIETINQLNSDTGEYYSIKNTENINIAYIPNIKISDYLFSYFKDDKLTGLVECVYHIYFDRWIPYKFK